MSASFYKKALSGALVWGMLPFAAFAQEKKGYIDVAWNSEMPGYQCTMETPGNTFIFTLDNSTYKTMNRAGALKKTVECNPVFDHFNIRAERLDKKENREFREKVHEEIDYFKRIDGLELGSEYKITLSRCSESDNKLKCLEGTESVTGKVTKSAD